MMCSPVSDRGPAKWHRDFYPPWNASLQAYADDILETGPRYVQWNLALYDDDVLKVVPGSHLRPNTDEENESISANPLGQVPGELQTQLEAGDGVAYILPILHQGSNYSTKLRRTIHGGFARLTHYAMCAGCRICLTRRRRPSSAGVPAAWLIWRMPSSPSKR